MSVSIDLLAVYGTDSLVLKQEFPNGKAATAFIKDYCLKQNKHVIVSSSGRVKKYNCPEPNCGWQVVCTKSKKAPCNFYISSMSTTHSDECIVAAKPSARQLAALPEFRVAVMSDSKISALALQSTVQATSRLPLDARSATTYRAKEKVLAERAGDYDDSFRQIPSLLRELKDANPGSTIVLEKDQEGRFFRAFVCLAGSVQCLPFCQQVYGFDGSHFKQSKYTGVVLTLVGRDGDNHNFPVAFAITSPTDGQLPQLGPPLFCDRGVLLTVAGTLERQENISLNLKYCTLHIIRNISRKFHYAGPRIENHVWDIQGAEKLHEYETALGNLKKDFGEAVEKYVRDIEPGKWTVHASTSKLYGWRTTNFVESNNAVLDKNGFRRDTPFQAIKTGVKAAMLAISTRGEKYTRWCAENRRFTPYAAALMQKEQEQAGAYEVSKSSSNVFFVNRVGKMQMQRVSMDPVGCSCTTFKQLGIPCRHILRVLHFTGKRSKLPDAFDRCYHVSAFEGFTGTSVELAVDDNLNTSIAVGAAPQYKQVGRRATSRIQSGGETGPTKVYRCRACGESSRHNKRTCRRHNGVPIVRPSQLFGASVNLDSHPSGDQAGSCNTPDAASGGGRPSDYSDLSRAAGCFGAGDAAVRVQESDGAAETATDGRDDGDEGEQSRLPPDLAFLLS